jgi:hypothetical protein
MHGEGIYIYSAGNDNSYSGFYKNGKKHGQGIIKENGKVVYEGEFFEGNPHGKGFRYDKNGNKIYVEMENGKRINNHKEKDREKNKEKDNPSNVVPTSKSVTKIGLSKIIY